MQTIWFNLARALATAGGAGFSAVATLAAGTADLDCRLHFHTKGWSAIYKRFDGEGSVNCADGSSMPVSIKLRGAGATFGKSQIDDGFGKFTDVRTINDVLGSYAQTEVHAGIVKSTTAQVLTKGTVSLALAGKGEGIDLGISIGEFTIEPAP